MFQSKLFRRLFSTYIIVIFTCLLVYTSCIIYENHKINQIQIERNCELQLEIMSEIMEKRLQSAQNIVLNLTYSTAMKKLYMSAKMDTTLDPYALYSIQTEMKNTMVSGSLSVYKTVIFLDEQSKAYSSGGVIMLDHAFQKTNDELPTIYYGNVNDVLGFDSKRYSFQKDFFIYCDGYTYQTGTDVGVICILFDLKALESDVKKILQDGYGARILYGDTPILTLGETSGDFDTCESGYIDGISYEIYAYDVKTETDSVFFIILLIILLTSAFFVWIAYWESKRYYTPINHLGQMVDNIQTCTVTADMPASSDDMAHIIQGIQALIGEKNKYHEKMMTIAPYAKAGMLHSMIEGNMEKDSVRIFSDENYIDLIHPYFIVSAINIICNGEIHPDYKKQVHDALAATADNFSCEEMNISYYIQDMGNIFLIISMEKEDIDDELFYQIHKYLNIWLTLQNCTITIGVDCVRDNIDELKKACKGAKKALDGILSDGRGEVFFYEPENSSIKNFPLRYYFPKDFKNNLKQLLMSRDKNEIHFFLFDIYDKNVKIHGSSEMYRALIEEFHLELLKTLREITELSSIHLTVEKYTDPATLEEVFNYYDAALLSIIDMLQEHGAQVAADLKLEDEMIQYIEDNIFNPDLSLQSLTDKYNVSNKYISLLCKNHYGVTYLQYIQTRRIQRAKQLLTEQKLSLTEIGILCGYPNQLTFRRNFKAITGVNPSDYLLSCSEKIDACLEKNDAT